MLTVTVKTVKQQTVKVEVEPSATVLDLKGKIQETLGTDFQAEWQKLIFKGKILPDTSIVGEIGLTDGGFVVVMVSKPKVAPAPAPAPVEPPPVAPAPSTQPTQSVPAPPTAPEGASGASQSTDQMIDNLMEMTGNSIPREHVKMVLARAQNNPVVAGAILAGGMEDLAAEPPQVEGTVPSGSVGGQPSEMAQATENPLQFLRSQPQFMQLRNLLHSNPDALPLVLSQIQQSNPELYGLINSNRTAFMELMNDPATGTAGGTSGGLGGTTSGTGPPTGAPGTGSAPSVSVTPTEMEAINRLKALGFPEHLVVQAYFACDKNEEMAANFLLSETDN